MWKHAQDGDVLVRTTEYSLPAHLDEHIELIQPTTAFNRAKGQRTTFRFSPVIKTALSSPSDKNIYVPGSGVTVDASVVHIVRRIPLTLRHPALQSEHQQPTGKLTKLCLLDNTTAWP